MLALIFCLLFIGVALIVLEIVVIPGTTLVGILGFIFTVSGIIVIYSQHGATAGHYAIAGTAAVVALVLYVSFKSGIWSKYSLKTANNSKVNDDVAIDVQIGERGVAVSALRPFGKASFHDKQYEVKTQGTYVENSHEIKVVNIIGKQIIVEPTN